jgi:Ergosterol biosynthesis ERG4/ERG24 family
MCCHPDQGKNAKPAKFEFLGPWGPAALLLLLPFVCYGLVYACNQDGCLQLSTLSTSLPGFPKGTRFVTWDALVVYCGWLALQAGLHILLPGKTALGVELPDKSQLQYKLNGEPVLLGPSSTVCQLSTCPIIVSRS